MSLVVVCIHPFQSVAAPLLLELVCVHQFIFVVVEVSAAASPAEPTSSIPVGRSVARIFLAMCMMYALFARLNNNVDQASTLRESPKPEVNRGNMFYPAALWYNNTMHLQVPHKSNKIAALTKVKKAL